MKTLGSIDSADTSFPALFRPGCAHADTCRQLETAPATGPSSKTGNRLGAVPYGAPSLRRRTCTTLAATLTFRLGKKCAFATPPTALVFSLIQMDVSPV
jgi:hypothetical protein